MSNPSAPGTDPVLPAPRREGAAGTPGHPPAYPGAWPTPTPPPLSQPPAPTPSQLVPQPPAYPQAQQARPGSVANQQSAPAKKSEFGQDLAALWPSLVRYLKGADLQVARDFRRRKYAGFLSLGITATLFGLVTVALANHGLSFLGSALSGLTRGIAQTNIFAAVQMSFATAVSVFLTGLVNLGIIFAMGAAAAYLTLRKHRPEFTYLDGLKGLGAAILPVPAVMVVWLLVLLLPATGGTFVLGTIVMIVASLGGAMSAYAFFRGIDHEVGEETSLLVPFVLWSALFSLVAVIANVIVSSIL